MLGIIAVLVFAWRAISADFAEGSKAAVAGALLAAVNTARNTGSGLSSRRCRDTLIIADALKAIPNPLVNEAITVTTLPA